MDKKFWFNYERDSAFRGNAQALLCQLSTDEKVKASDIRGDMEPQACSRILMAARKVGLVDASTRSQINYWYLTPKGEQFLNTAEAS